MGLIRIDRLSDEQASQLHRLYLGEWWTNRRTPDDVRTMLAAPSQLIVAFADDRTGELAAFARIVTDFVYKGLVLDVIVHPDHREAGLGGRLMDEVVGHPDLANVKHLELYCRPELVPFYERWGFTADLGELRFMRRGT